MTDRTREQRLHDLLQLEEKSGAGDLEMVLHKRNKVRLGAVYSSMAGLSQTRGTYAYFVKGQADELRQHFYVASKLTLKRLETDFGEPFETPHHFFYALLSDNAEVINAMAYVETPELIKARNNPLWARFHVYMLQLAIRDEHDALQVKIEQLAKNGQKLFREDAAKGQDFYSLLIKRDKAGLERLIQRWAIRQEGWAHLKNLLAEGSTLRAKLCWLKGIPVQIEGPWVPMALMPVQPLAHYDDEYEFLKPGWVPPPQGVLGKISRWLK